MTSSERFAHSVRHHFSNPPQDWTVCKLATRRWAIVIVASQFGIDVAPGHLALKELERTGLGSGGQLRLARQLDDIEGYDFVLLDCPPALGELTTAALAAADYVLAVLKAGPDEVDGLVELGNSILDVQETLNPDVEIRYVLLADFDGNPKASKDVRRQLRADWGEWADVRTAAAAAATAEPVGPSQEAGEKVLLALRDLADNDAEAWWAWEPARAGEVVSAGQALRAWWCAALEVVGVEEAEELVQSRERAERMLQQREGHGDIAVLQGMKVWTRQADGVRELAQQRRDLITESATAAATTLHRATLQRATPGVGPVLSDWVADATARARQWRDRDAADAHLAELADPAYREKLERIPEYWS